MSSEIQIVKHRCKGSLQIETSLKWLTVTIFLIWQSCMDMDFKVWRVWNSYHTITHNPSKIGLIKASLPKAILSSDM